jgi:uncharacterized RDD family membrane protein YckC
MTRCRYCGALNEAEELRCVKCQRRMPLEHSRPDHPPVVATAVAPAYDPQPVPQPAAAPAGNHAPSQPSLFPFRPAHKVIAIGATAEPRVERQQRSSPRRKTYPGQTAFEFSPLDPPARPLSRELDSKMAQLPVAPRTLRAIASAADGAIILIGSGVFLLTLHALSRYALGASLFTKATLPYLAATPIFIGLMYKLFWCLGGGCTPGIQGVGLRLVSFDGTAPSQSQRMFRLFGGCLSFAACALGLLWALGDQETLTWHDHVSQTFLTGT